MKPTAPPGRTAIQIRRATLAAAAAAVALVVSVEPASAGSRGPWHLAFGPFAGSIVLDSHLGDFRWDTRARAVWGASGRAGVERLGLGARVWRASTTQSLGIPGEDLAPEVQLTGTEILGETRLAHLAGFRLLASGTVGLLHFGYSPDALTVDDGSGGSFDVTLDPVTEWSAGLGLGVRRSLGGGLDASVSVDRSWFRLDTAHRVGNSIVEDRETFGNWTARVELTHRILQI